MTAGIKNRGITSVITIFFNPGVFLEEAIESVFAQTENAWELLLVDDGSEDGSTETALHYERLRPDKVRYLSHQGRVNLGMSASRNLGIQHALGTWVAFIDADDVWFPTKIEEQRRLLESNPRADMLFGKYDVWYSWRKDAVQPDMCPDLPVLADTLTDPPELALLCYPLGTKPAPSMSDLIIRKELLEQIGGFESQFTGMYEDQAFLIKAYLTATIYVSGQCWSRYRKHDHSCSTVTNQQGNYHKSRFAYLRWLEGYLKRRVTHGAVSAALEKAIWPYLHPRLHSASGLLRRAARFIKGKHPMNPSGA
ncbi:MAG: glycosyltransferase family 2 protein [Bryobacteraceae bacterium]|nr:glycosyltransferase family 2 protein [Bryobacteraceae bacterium]